MPRAIPNPEPLAARPARTKTGVDTSGRPGAYLIEPVGGSEALLSPAAASLLRQSDGTDADSLRTENARLRETISMLEKSSPNKGAGQDWSERQKEYEGLLEEKSEIIRTLHRKIQELEQRPAPKAPTPEEEELVAMSEQLERDRHQLQQERKQLDDELRQFKDDEEAMTRQMREMEVQMARERADLARQKTDVQRMLDELRHELERYERDQGLNDRLGMLRQRYHEVARRGTANGRPDSVADSATPPGAPTPSKGNGLFGRLFGQGK